MDCLVYEHEKGCKWANSLIELANKALSQNYDDSRINGFLSCVDYAMKNGYSEFVPRFDDNKSKPRFDDDFMDDVNESNDDDYIFYNIIIRYYFQNPLIFKDV